MKSGNNCKFFVTLEKSGLMIELYGIYSINVEYVKDLL